MPIITRSKSKAIEDITKTDETSLEREEGEIVADPSDMDDGNTSDVSHETSSSESSAEKDMKRMSTRQRMPSPSAGKISKYRRSSTERERKRRKSPSLSADKERKKRDSLSSDDERRYRRRKSRSSSRSKKHKRRSSRSVSSEKELTRRGSHSEGSDREYKGSKSSSIREKMKRKRKSRSISSERARHKRKYRSESREKERRRKRSHTPTNDKEKIRGKAREKTSKYSSRSARSPLKISINSEKARRRKSYSSDRSDDSSRNRTVSPPAKRVKKSDDLDASKGRSDGKENSANASIHHVILNEKWKSDSSEETLMKRELSARELEIARLRKEESEKNENEIDNDPVWSLKRAQIEKASRQCPYLDTIDRCALDFDFEKLCSVSLSHVNVYACMVCGKYFQGRGTSTHAYTHSLNDNHRVFLNLNTLKFYCLPDNYEIIDPSLDDIKYVLKPTYVEGYINKIDQNTKMSRAFDGTVYYPGVVGLNNIKANDYENVVLHALSHVPPLRDYFLREENYINIKRPPGDMLALLPKRFGELIRKLWNPKAFKAHVSPHEMLQASVLCSRKKFQITKQGDAAEFLNFLLNTLHTALNGTRKTSSSVVYKIFRGHMFEYTRKVIPVETSEEVKRNLLDSDEYKEKMKENPFIYLTLDLPAAPLYRDEMLQNIIPQIPLSVLLTKFNGIVEKEYKTYSENFMKRFELVRLPPYLIIMYKRFHKNQWFVEKNPTIVNFPISNIDLYDCLAESSRSLHEYTTYDLVSNIVHDGPPENGSYRVQLLHNGTQKWYELEDLHVKEILPQMITLAESYIQIWKLNTSKTREQRMGEMDQADMSLPNTENAMEQ